jgi:hypothetical protein
MFGASFAGSAWSEKPKLNRAVNRLITAPSRTPLPLVLSFGIRGFSCTFPVSAVTGKLPR